MNKIIKMASKGDYALEQEKYSAELIEKANSEQEGLLKLAKELATKELESYNEERRKEYDNKVTELNVNEKLIDEINNKSKAEIDDINNNFGARKDQVVDFLFENVINVKYEIPEVVKGFFEEKFGIAE